MTRNMNRTTSLCVRPPPSLKRALEKVAASEGISVNELVNRALEEAVAPPQVIDSPSSPKSPTTLVKDFLP